MVRFLGKAKSVEIILLEVASKPWSKYQIRDIISLKKMIITTFGMWKEVNNGSDMRKLLGIELRNLKAFKEFMGDYKKFAC
jgi:hypothetical protein